MNYEDALTILSYASPYPMTLRLAQCMATNDLAADSSSNAEPTREQNQVYHPVYRSQSLGGSKTDKESTLPQRPGTSLEYSKIYQYI